MSEGLKACPFCGKMKTIHRKGNYQDGIGIYDPGRVYCSICGGETSYYWWQKRPIEDALRSQLDIAVEALKAQLIFKERNPFVSQGDFDHLYEIACNSLAEINRIGEKHE
jgi:hypothetical protein